MDWEHLLSSERLGDTGYQAKPNRSIFVQDYDRIIFSAPFRRLANKTQVQPLYEHDHVHHRLIHSVEVASVGRSLAMAIGNWLEQENEIEAGEAHSLANIVQAACVAHDIGNPPFGHSGEEAMGDWFADQFSSSNDLISEVPSDRQLAFKNFEGNAQGFRILCRLEMYRNDGGMRLSKATLGAFTKYPVTASTRESAASGTAAGYVGLKKFGIFDSELESFRGAASTLGLVVENQGDKTWWRRHPLVFVVEAADDICYNIVDLEDAFTTGEVGYDVVRDILYEAAGKPNRDVSTYTAAENIAMLRAISIGKAVESCVEAFKENYAAIMSGNFSGSLADICSMKSLFERMKKVSKNEVFTARRKTELEISGRKIIWNVMTGILPVYEDLRRSGWKEAGLTAHSCHLVRALGLDLRNVNTSEDALHALADFTSGMTDRYALRISRMLSGT